jgi:hypothetical protein
MPAKPVWYRRLDEIVSRVERLSQPWVDRQMVQEVLRIGPRRAQQILQSCLTGKVGTSSVVTRDAFLAHLKTLASGDDSFYEQQRRRRFARTLAEWRQKRQEQPQLLVEAPAGVMDQELATLPPGVELGPGVVSVRFHTSQEALEKLLALAMAIGRDFIEFERRTSLPNEYSGK